MLCRLVRRWLIPYTEGELSAVRQRLAERHIARCSGCRASLHTIQATLDVLQDAFSEQNEAMYTPTADLWPRLRARLPDRPLPYRRPRTVVAWGLAALCLVFGAAGYLTTRRPSAINPPSQRMASVPPNGRATPREPAKRGPERQIARAGQTAPIAGSLAKPTPPSAPPASTKRAGRRHPDQMRANVRRTVEHATKTRRAKQDAIALRMATPATSSPEKPEPPPAPNAERQPLGGQPNAEGPNGVMSAAPANAAVRREGEPHSQALTQVPGGGQSSVQTDALAARAKATSAEAPTAMPMASRMRAAPAPEAARAATGFGGTAPKPSEAAIVRGQAQRSSGAGSPAAPATPARGHMWLEDARRAKSQGKVDRAAAFYEIALRAGLTDGELAEAYEALGDLAAQKGRYAQAAAEYAHAAAANPSRELLIKQAAALTRCGRQNEAHEVLRRTMSLPAPQGTGPAARPRGGN